LGAIERRTPLPCAPSDALSVSLDIDVELVIGAKWRLRTVRGEYGFRTSGVMARGEMVRWAMRLGGVLPVRHTTKIVSLVEDDGRGGASFVDQMTTGVFSSYRHVHVFRPAEGGTEMVDDVTWTSPAGPFGALADRLFVRRMLERLLDDRNAEILRRVSS
jgi:ligand-binding SRPBCC domain-containing protein